MRSFTLIWANEDPRGGRRIEFSAFGPAAAFDLLEQEEAGRTAILWEGTRRVASMRRTRIGGWHISA